MKRWHEACYAGGGACFWNRGPGRGRPTGTRVRGQPTATATPSLGIREASTSRLDRTPGSSVRSFASEGRESLESLLRPQRPESGRGCRKGGQSGGGRRPSPTTTGGRTAPRVGLPTHSPFAGKHSPRPDGPSDCQKAPLLPPRLEGEYAHPAREGAPPSHSKDRIRRVERRYLSYARRGDGSHRLGPG